MSQSFLTVPLHFTVEFLGFLVTAAGAFLVVTRPTLTRVPAKQRVAIALGLAALAAAQVAHGGSFVAGDSDSVVMAMRAVGFALMFAGLLRTAPRAGAAVVVTKPFAFITAAAALAVAAVAGRASLRGGASVLQRLSIGAAFLATSEVLLALAPEAPIGSGDEGPFVYGSHGAKLVGYVALAAWLSSGLRASIRTRFIASFGALLVAVVLSLSTALTGVIYRNVSQEELSRMRAQLETATETIERGATRQLLTDVQQIADRVGRRMRRGTRLRDLPNDLLELDIWTMDFVVLTTPKGRLLSYSKRGPAKEDAHGELVATKLTKRGLLDILGSRVVQDVIGVASRSASLENFGDSVANVAAAEVEDRRRTKAMAIVTIGRYVDAETMEVISTSLRPARASLVTGRRLLASELPRVARASDLVVGDARRQLAGGEIVTRRHSIGDRSYFSALGQLRSDNGVPIGATLALSSPARVLAGTRDLTRALFVVAMGVGALALVLAWLSGRRITRPIHALTRTAAAVREGDLTARATVSDPDEVGQLGQTFNDMTAALFRMTAELRAAAREEHRLRARIETIVESMADGLVAVDAQRTIVAFNRRAEELTGVRAQDAVGKVIDDVIDTRDADGSRVVLPIFELAEGSVAEVFLARSGRDPVPTAVTSAVIRGDDDEIAGGVAVVRDMTREHEVEAMKSQFLSNISHELRTPLTPIKGYAEVLGAQQLPPEKARRFVSEILKSTARLERIIELLIDFSAVERGGLAATRKPVDIGALIERLADQWSARSARHRVVADVDDSLPDVTGDERLLRRSFEEVLDNAFKFSPEGGTIVVEARPTVVGDGHPSTRAVRVTVSDEGIGIASDDLEKIFSDFRQLDGSETRAYGGLGLGLAFVHRIVEAHDGFVEVDSEPRRGTRVMMTVPVGAQ